MFNVSNGDRSAFIGDDLEVNDSGLCILKELKDLLLLEIRDDILNSLDKSLSVNNAAREIGEGDDRNV